MCIGLPPNDANCVLSASPVVFAGLKLTITGSIVGTMRECFEYNPYLRQYDVI